MLVLRSLISQMNLKRTSASMVVGGALAAWFAAAATSDDRPVASPPVVETSPVDARDAELAKEVARLQEHLRSDVVLRHQRNLFQFASSSRRQLAPLINTSTPALTESPTRAPVVLPEALKLVGLAESPGPDGPERTAIISGLGQLFLVKEGEDVTLRYRVAKISADVVELADKSDDTILRLAMK